MNIKMLLNDLFTPYIVLYNYTWGS